VVLVNLSHLTADCHLFLQVLNVLKMGGNTLVELAVNRNLLDPDCFPYASGVSGECLISIQCRLISCAFCLLGFLFQIQTTAIIS
jgi:hypothetical protein